MKLNKEKSQIVEFSIEIEGTDDKISPRLVLKGNDMSIVYEGKMQGKNAIFEVSKLDKLFENAKSTEAEIEVIVENRYFKPWKSTIEFDVPVRVTVTESSQPRVVEPKVQVEAKLKSRNLEVPSIKEGQRKIKINGKLVDVLVTKVLTENGQTILKIIDSNGKGKTIRLK
jgi:hypothetical protein